MNTGRKSTKTTSKYPLVVRTKTSEDSKGITGKASAATAASVNSPNATQATPSRLAVASPRDEKRVKLKSVHEALISGAQSMLKQLKLPEGIAGLKSAIALDPTNPANDAVILQCLTQVKSLALKEINLEFTTLLSLLVEELIKSNKSIALDFANQLIVFDDQAERHYMLHKQCLEKAKSKLLTLQKSSKSQLALIKYIETTKSFEAALSQLEKSKNVDSQVLEDLQKKIIEFNLKYKADAKEGDVSLAISKTPFHTFLEGLDAIITHDEIEIAKAKKRDEEKRIPVKLFLNIRDAGDAFKIATDVTKTKNDRLMAYRYTLMNMPDNIDFYRSLHDFVKDPANAPIDEKMLSLTKDDEELFVSTHEYQASILNPGVACRLEGTQLLFSGVQKLITQQFDAALADFTRAKEFLPQDSLSPALTGIALTFLKKDQAALEQYEHAIQLSQGYIYFAAYYLLASPYLDKEINREKTEAVFLYPYLSAIDNMPMLHVFKDDLIKLQIERIKEVLAADKAAGSVIAKRESERFVKLARDSKDNPIKAVLHCKQALRIYPGSIEGLILAGESQVAIAKCFTGRLANATTDEQVLHRQRIVNSFAESFNNYTQAYDYLSDLIKINPQDCNSLRLMGRLLTGQFAVAESLSKANPRLVAQCGVIISKLKENQKLLEAAITKELEIARSSLDAKIEVRPQSPAALEKTKAEQLQDEAQKKEAEKAKEEVRKAEALAAKKQADEERAKQAKAAREAKEKAKQLAAEQSKALAAQAAQAEKARIDAENAKKAVDEKRRTDQLIRKQLVRKNREITNGVSDKIEYLISTVEQLDIKRIQHEQAEKRIADLAAAKKLAEEQAAAQIAAEAARKADEAAEAKRQAEAAAYAACKAAEEAEAKRLAAEAEAKRLAEEKSAAFQQRIAAKKEEMQAKWRELDAKTAAVTQSGNDEKAPVMKKIPQVVQTLDSIPKNLQGYAEFLLACEAQTKHKFYLTGGSVITLVRAMLSDAQPKPNLDEITFDDFDTATTIPLKDLQTSIINKNNFEKYAEPIKKISAKLNNISADKHVLALQRIEELNVAGSVSNLAVLAKDPQDKSFSHVVSFCHNPAILEEGLECDAELRDQPINAMYMEFFKESGGIKAKIYDPTGLGLKHVLSNPIVVEFNGKSSEDKKKKLKEDPLKIIRLFYKEAKLGGVTSIEDKNLIKSILQENKDLFKTGIPEPVLQGRLIKIRNKFLSHEIFNRPIAPLEAAAKRKKYECFVRALHEMNILSLLPTTIAKELVSRMHFPESELPGIPLHLLPAFLAQNLSPKLPQTIPILVTPESGDAIRIARDDKLGFFAGSAGPSFAGVSSESQVSASNASPCSLTVSGKKALRRHPAFFGEINQNAAVTGTPNSSTPMSSSVTKTAHNHYKQ